MRAVDVDAGLGLDGTLDGLEGLARLEGDESCVGGSCFERGGCEVVSPWLSSCFLSFGFSFTSSTFSFVVSFPFFAILLWLGTSFSLPLSSLSSFFFCLSLFKGLLCLCTGDSSISR